MDDFSKTKEQLIKELEELRAKINQLGRDNIARQKEEQSLRLTQFTVDRAADAVFWMGRDARFFYVNDIACRSLGYSREELLSMTVQDIDPDYTPDVWLEHWNEVKRRESFTFESRHRKKDGRIFPVEITVNYLEFKGMEYNCAFARDITERRRAEESLIHEKHRLEEVTSFVNCGLMLLDDQTRVVYANRVLEGWFGPFYQIMGKTCYEIFGTADPEHECACLRTLRTGKSVRTDEFVMSIDGRAMCLNIITFPLKDESENVYEITAVVIDITERKKKEEELKKFKFISDHANDAHFLVDANAKFRYVNETACRMMGYPEKKLLSLRVPDVDMIYDMPKYRDLFDKIQKGKVPPIQTVNKRNDGTVFCSEITVTGYKIGDQPFMFAVLRDVTDRMDAEAQIKKSLKEKEVLLKEVHHRVKNNLSVVYSLLQLQIRYVKEKRYKEMFHESMDRIKSMAIIHEKLYRSDDLGEINFGDYLSDMVDSLFLSYGLSPEKVTLKKDVEKITLDINASVPCGLIVNELVSNALKYAFPEGRQGEISLSLRRKNNDEIELAVSDNGIGMPEGLDYRKSGTLGLTLVKSLVSQIEGKIELYGEQGTGFRITFRKQK